MWSVLWPHEDGDPHLRLLPLLGGEHGHPVEEGLHHGRLGDHQGQRDGREETLRPRSVSIISRLSPLTSFTLLGCEKLGDRSEDKKKIVSVHVYQAGDLH